MPLQLQQRLFRSRRREDCSASNSLQPCRQDATATHIALCRRDLRSQASQRPQQHCRGIRHERCRVAADSCQRRISLGIRPQCGAVKVTLQPHAQQRGQRAAVSMERHQARRIMGRNQRLHRGGSGSELARRKRARIIAGVKPAASLTAAADRVWRKGPVGGTKGGALPNSAQALGSGSR